MRQDQKQALNESVRSKEEPMASSISTVKGSRLGLRDESGARRSAAFSIKPISVLSITHGTPCIVCQAWTAATAFEIALLE